MMNDAAVAATAHANPFARFARIEFKAHPHFIAQPGRSHVPMFLPAGSPEQRRRR
jgi:hypothetical protein